MTLSSEYKRYSWKIDFFFQSETYAYLESIYQVL